MATFSETPFALRLVQCIFLLAMMVWPCKADVEMVIVIHRHGARTRLSKNASTLAESSSTLTRIGMQQLYSVGSQVRQRYLQQPSCGVTGTCLTGQWDTYTNTLWYAQSSGIDRTLASANYFQLGALSPNGSLLSSAAATDTFAQPGGLNLVPVYSMPSAADYLIRAYADEKCPAYLDNLQTFYSSPQFAAKEAETNALTTTLSGLLQKNVTLLDMFNVFDQYNVQRDYGANTPAGGPALPPLDNSTWEALVSAADWLEWARYGEREVAQNLCGGGLLGEIVTRILKGTGFMQPPGSLAVGPKFIEYSAHYPTMMCLLAAMNVSTGASQGNAQLLPQIYDYAAALIFQVERNDQDLSVRLLLQNGPGAPFAILTLPCGGEACSLGAFVGVVNGSALYSAGDFCRACNSAALPVCADSVVADRNTTIQSLTGQLHKKGRYIPRWSVAVAVLLSVLLGAICGVVGTLFWLKQKSSKDPSYFRSDL